MRQTSFRLLIALFVVGVLAALPLSAQCICDLNNQQFRGSLFGNQFASGPLAPGGFGTFEGRFNSETGTADFDVRTRGIGLDDEVTSFTLVRLSDGQIVSTMTPTDQGRGVFSSSVELSPALTREIRRSPANFNLRVNTVEFPSGAIQGPVTFNRRFTGTFAGDDRIALTTNFRNTATGDLVTDFELLSDDIETIESIELFDRQTGETVSFFDESGTLIDGRLFGEDIQIEGTVADDFLEDPDRFDFVVRSSEVEGGELRTRFANANDLFIPVVGAAPGALGTTWDTDLRIFNTSWDDSGTVVLTFYPRGGQLDPVSTSLDIEPRQTLTWDRAMEQLFPGSDGIGALRISTSAEVVASARIFNDRRDVGEGTFGQLMSALTACDAMTRGVLTGITDSAGTVAGSFAARTNVGLFNPTDQQVQVQLTLRDADGDVSESRVVFLGPFMHSQTALIAENGWFDIDDDLTSATLSFEASSPIFVYGSVVDNTSGDPSTLMPRADFGVPAL